MFYGEIIFEDGAKFNGEAEFENDINSKVYLIKGQLVNKNGSKSEGTFDGTDLVTGKV
jgi:hypothetical protein